MTIDPVIVLSIFILSFINPAIVLSIFILSFIDPAISRVNERQYKYGQYNSRINE
jgi:hypothetical protein